jgi:hypothetical protein
MAHPQAMAVQAEKEELGKLLVLKAKATKRRNGKPKARTR